MPFEQKESAVGIGHQTLQLKKMEDTKTPDRSKAGAFEEQPRNQRRWKEVNQVTRGGTWGWRDRRCHTVSGQSEDFGFTLSGKVW